MTPPSLSLAAGKIRETFSKVFEQVKHSEVTWRLQLVPCFDPGNTPSAPLFCPPLCPPPLPRPIPPHATGGVTQINLLLPAVGFGLK